jgi:hypothetical protein
VKTACAGDDIVLLAELPDRASIKRGGSLTLELVQYIEADLSPMLWFAVNSVSGKEVP